MKKLPFLRRAWWWTWRCIAALLFAAVIAYAFFTGPRNVGQYPSRETSPYHLPWPAGVTRLCVQGNRAVVSHRGWEEFAYDFGMPVGSEVCAMREGVVTRVVAEHDGNGMHAPNNLIAIRHEDGTEAYYLHIRKDGAMVRKSDRVTRGQLIAESGNVGKSLMPHLHVHLLSAQGNHVPFTFADVPGDAGIPRMFKRYTAAGSSQLRTPGSK